jgi:predicted MFS family arabinose efflux permease
MESTQGEVSALVERITETAGGPARLRVILLLAAVLALQSADIGSIGALASQLEKALDIGNTQLGLLITVTALVGAGVAFPAGGLADRANRVRLLSWAIGLWSLGMIGSGLAANYTMLLLARVALGVLAAVCGPMVASLTGDLFPAQDRSRIYGMILTGELLGTGVGLVIAAEVGAVAGWRAPFFVLAVPSIGLAVLLWRLLPEPARGGQSWLYPGAEEIKPAEEVDRQEPPAAGGTAQSLGVDEPFPADEPSPADEPDVRRRARARKDVHANSKLVLRQDPSRLSPRAAVTYILRIRSNLVLIAASVLGYFFLAGLQAFAVLFAEDHFGVSQALVTLVLIVVGAGGLGGTLYGGRLADTLVRKGVADARVLVAGLAFTAAALTFVPGLLSSSLLIAIPLLTVAAAFVAAPQPPLDAARLDVVPSGLWGRAEAVRSFARNLLQSFAPLLFGYVSASFGGPRSSPTGAVGHASRQAAALAGRGLEYTFILMLAPMLVGGVLLLLFRHIYLVDVATADVSETTSRRFADAARLGSPAAAGPTVQGAAGANQS